MYCPYCQHPETKVIDSRLIADGLAIRRRRECLKCKTRFSTIEELQILNLTVIKRNGKKESYDNNKIYNGLKKAFKKRPFSDDEIKKVLFSIEREIQSKSKKQEIASSEIGEIVMNTLKKTDKVAYIRFASVYQGFETIEEFAKAIKEVINNIDNE